MKSVRGALHTPLDRGLARLADAGRKLLAKLTPGGWRPDDYSGLVGRPVLWTVGGDEHRMWLRLAAGSGHPRLMIASTPREIGDALGR